MKYLIIILFALICATAKGQPPRIDSMLIDEPKSQLSVYGDFGSAKGKVWCDSVDLPIISWSSNIIVVNIPDTGKGSAGEVVVAGRSLMSPPRLIFKWEGRWNSSYNQGHNELCEIQGTVIDSVFFSIRTDIQSLQESRASKTSIRPIRNTTLIAESRFGVFGRGGNIQWYDLPYFIPLVFKDSLYDSGFHLDITFDRINNIFLCYVYGVVSYRHVVDKYGSLNESCGTDYSGVGPFLDTHFGFTIPLNDDFIIMQSDAYFDPSFNRIAQIVAFNINYSFSSPALQSPKNGSEELTTELQVLKWKPLPTINSYHIQCSIDSTLSVVLFDERVDSLSLSLHSLEKNTTYYWRAEGINSQGKSKWSPTWSFTTGEYLLSSPTLQSPKNGSEELTTDLQILKWDSLPTINSYHVQYSIDSTFSIASFDEIVDSLSLPLYFLEKNTTYYWRVEGINSKGKSKWSPTWSFTTGEKAAVARLGTANSYSSIYPNPSTGKVSIQCPELFKARVLIYNLQGNIIYQTHLDQNGSAEWDASAMASGRYIIGLMSGSELRSAVVSIVK